MINIKKKCVLFLKFLIFDLTYSHTTTLSRFTAISILLLYYYDVVNFVFRCRPQYKANAKAVDHEGRTCLQHVRAACRGAAGAASVQDVGPLTDLLVQNGCPENGTSTLTRPLDILPSSVI